MRIHAFLALALMLSTTTAQALLINASATYEDGSAISFQAVVSDSYVWVDGWNDVTFSSLTLTASTVLPWGPTATFTQDDIPSASLSLFESLTDGNTIYGVGADDFSFVVNEAAVGGFHFSMDRIEEFYAPSSGFSNAISLATTASLEVTTVPEPTTFALLSLGLVGIVVARRKVRV